MSDQDRQLEQAVSNLSNWFGSCQIFVTWQDGGETHSAIVGSGNNFATLALVTAWLKMQETVGLLPEDDEDDDTHAAFN